MLRFRDLGSSCFGLRFRVLRFRNYRRQTDSIRVWWPNREIIIIRRQTLQAIVQQQKSYLKDITDFMNYRENTKVPEDVILVSMDVTSLYTNIPQVEGIHTVCRAYETFYINKPPTLHNY